jgi:putative nucleic acid binding protein
MEIRKKYRSIMLLLLPALLLVSYFIIKSGKLLSGESHIIHKADFHLAARDLSCVFTHDELQSDQRYLYKTLSVSGVINKVRKDESGNYMVSLRGNDFPGQSFSISCTLDSLYNQHSSSLKTGDSTTIRGICAGVLHDVVLLQCIIEK